jgi:hypothetical protein
MNGFNDFHHNVVAGARTVWDSILGLGRLAKGLAEDMASMAREDRSAIEDGPPPELPILSWNRCKEGAIINGGSFTNTDQVPKIPEKLED